MECNRLWCKLSGAEVGCGRGAKGGKKNEPGCDIQGCDVFMDPPLRLGLMRTEMSWMTSSVPVLVDPV